MLPFWGGKCLPLRFIRVTRLRTETNRPLGGCLMGYIHRNPWSIHSAKYVCVEYSTNNVVSMCVCKCNRVWEYFSWQPHPKLIPPTISPTSPLLPPRLFDTISFWPFDWWSNHGQYRRQIGSPLNIQECQFILSSSFRLAIKRIIRWIKLYSQKIKKEFIKPYHWWGYI